MEKKQLDWSNLGFGYIQTEKRYVSTYKDGAWSEGMITEAQTACQHPSLHRHCNRV